MATVRHGRSAAPPTVCRTAVSCGPTTHRSLGRLAGALLGLALFAYLLAPAAAASAQPSTLSSLATTVASTSPSSAGPAWAAAADRIGPTVASIGPASAPNDVDTPVVITGTDFAAVMSGTVVLTAPTASLGGTTLTNVTFINSSTLTATIPWGMDPGVYTLTVLNPENGNGALTGAFTVTQGIGQWNGGTLFGGSVQRVEMKPGDPTTLYVVAGDVGLFRSKDGGEHWSFVTGDVSGDAGFGVDPLHPSWLYSYVFGGQVGSGLFRSKDEGSTWTQILGRPGGGGITYATVYPSPNDPQVIFLAYSGWDSKALGLTKSTDGGASWKVVADMQGFSVETVAFHPTDPSKMVLATTSGQVFQSADAGSHWSEVLKPPLSSIGLIAYNPYRPTEVWIASTPTPAAHYEGTGGIYKSANAAFTSWQNATPLDAQPNGTSFLTFTGESSVYTNGRHSADGGGTWQGSGPMGGFAGMIFDPAAPQVGYGADNTWGVQKTTDGGQTWEIKNQGLAAMYCTSIAVSPTDPLRVFGTFSNLPGIYRSNDGTSNWTYLPIPGAGSVIRVCEDSFDHQRLYAAADNGLYVSPNEGESWSDLGWTTTPSSAPGGPADDLAADPHHPGHMLVALRTSAGAVALYASSDSGVSWQALTMPQGLAGLKEITNIAFDPETPGLVYLTTPGNGVYRSTDSGSSWQRIDDRRQPDMLSETCSQSIAIATHPRHVLFIGAEQGPFRSFDGGATWEPVQNPPGGTFGYMFVDGDSTRLYAATAFGLFFSNNAGDSWTRAAGVFGRLRVSALGNAIADGHAIIYAATTGGELGATSGTAAKTSRASGAATRFVGGGIYRYVQLSAPKLTLRLSGLTRGVLKLGKRITAKGVVTPGRFAGSKVTLTVQTKRGTKWVRIKTVARTSRASGAYGWKYKPGKRGSYRLQATIAKTTKTAGAKTTWRTFKVK